MNAYFHLLLSLLLAPVVQGDSSLFKAASSDPGNIKIGLVFPGHECGATRQNPCGSLHLVAALVPTQFKRIIEDINNAGLLPYGMQLGYEIFDSCGSPNLVLSEALTWVTKNNESSSTVPMVAVVGSGFSRASQKLASFLSFFGIPVVDYGATSRDLSNPINYPLYSRVVASDDHMAKAMADLVVQLKWECVHVLYSEGQYGVNGGEAVSTFLVNASRCIANGGPKMLPLDEFGKDEQFDLVVHEMQQSRLTRPVICFCEASTIRGLLRAIKRLQDPNQPMQFFIIAGDFWGNDINLKGIEDVAKHSISFQTTAIPGKALWNSTGLNADLLGWVKQAQYRTPPSSDVWLEKLVEITHQCTLSAEHSKQTRLPLCKLSKFKNSDMPQSDWLALVSNAVYATAFGVRSFLIEKCDHLKNMTACTKFDAQDGFRLYHHITNATFELENGENFAFYQQRDGYPRMEVYKFYGSNYEKIGKYDAVSGLNLTCDWDELAFNEAVPGANCSKPLCFIQIGGGAILPSCKLPLPENKASSCPTNQTALITVAVVLSSVIVGLIGVIIALMVQRRYQLFKK